MDFCLLIVVEASYFLAEVYVFV